MTGHAVDPQVAAWIVGQRHREVDSLVVVLLNRLHARQTAVERQVEDVGALAWPKANRTARPDFAAGGENAHGCRPFHLNEPIDLGVRNLWITMRRLCIRGVTRSVTWRGKSVTGSVTLRGKRVTRGKTVTGGVT